MKLRDLISVSLGVFKHLFQMRRCLHFSLDCRHIEMFKMMAVSLSVCHEYYWTKSTVHSRKFFLFVYILTIVWLRIVGVGRCFRPAPSLLRRPLIGFLHSSRTPYPFFAWDIWALIDFFKKILNPSEGNTRNLAKRDLSPKYFDLEYKSERKRLQNKRDEFTLRMNSAF